jgi:signal transduction histidine kinase/ligand-binding sensor domain-containing protein/DNA-binding response OmpR family regulator
MSPKGGFYFDGVKSIEQDYYGFIWVVMDDELYRFDGFEYKKYYARFASIDNSKKWEFFNITSNSRGDIYVNTNNGLYSYDRNSDSFSLIYKSVTTLITDKADNLWVWTNAKWNILDIRSGKLVVPLLNGEAVSSTNTVFCMHNDDLYLFSANKIYRYNYVKNELSLCCTLSEKELYIRQAKAHQGKLWVYAHKYGLYKIDLSTFNIEDRFDFIPEENNLLRSFLIDKKGSIWIGTLNGLYILNPITREYSHYIHSEKDPFSLPNNSIWTIREDRRRNIWIGTYSGAICYVNIDENNAFKSYTPQNSALSLSPVSAFAEDNTNLWVGTEGGGINIINKETGQFKYIANKKNLNSNNIKSLTTDAEHNFWVATFMGGLSRITYDHNTDSIHIKHYNNVPGDSASLLVNDIKKIILESDSGLWVAYQNRKLQISYLSFKNEKFAHIRLDHKDYDDYIFDIQKQNEKYLWAISSEKIYRLDLETYDIEKFSLNDSIYATLYTFCLDASGYMWIGTIGNGIIKFDPATGRHIPLNDLLKNNIYSVYNICYDDGNIWIGTDNGLYCYSIAQNNLQKFDEGEGTQGQVYYPLASMKSKNGMLYFGGTSGFTVVDPEKISHNEYKPKVIISDFLIDYVPNKVKTAGAGDENEIILNHNQTNFGLRFSSDNYLIPEKNRFKYRLKGYDDRWIETDAYNRTALYTKVPPDIYYFEILTANNDGVWNDIPSVIKINRKPAPWLSKPAYVVYLIIVITILLFILRYYNDKKKLEMQLYLENIEKQKKEEIHQSQLRFFTNISHDFRTPLSLIIASLEKLRQEGLKEYYYRILSSNAKRLLNLVNELMDFRTVENGKMKLELQPVDVNHYVKKLGEDFADYARQREINYNIVCDPELPEELFVDKNILEKVIMNLLNNAFKYTPKGGTINLETHRTPFKSIYKNKFVVNGDIIPEQTFSITIRDSGVGISEESIQFIFERFYKANTVNFDSNLSTGIGLALVKSLILLHRGIIKIYSEKEKGSDISVLLSVNKNIYDKESFMDVPVQDKDSALHKKNDNNDLDESLENDIRQIRQKSKKRILIAEDNDDLRHIISDYLSEEYDVIQAKDGMEASNILSQKVIDLIISDIMMPRKDGIAFCKEVKESIETSHIPFILLTAKTSLESKLEGADSGADIYFEKPVDLQLLKRSIYNVFKHRQQVKEYYAKNHFADSAELSSNERDAKFLQDFIHIIEENLDHPDMDVNYIASQLSMSRSKLYRKIKTMTDKSIIEFILSYKMKKAAKLIIEEDVSLRQVMDRIGIESQPYFTNAFKKEFDETPSAFSVKHKKNTKQ